MDFEVIEKNWQISYLLYNSNVWTKTEGKCFSFDVYFPVGMSPLSGAVRRTFKWTVKDLATQAQLFWGGKIKLVALCPRRRPRLCPNGDGLYRVGCAENDSCSCGGGEGGPQAFPKGVLLPSLTANPSWRRLMFSSLNRVRWKLHSSSPLQG